MGEQGRLGLGEREVGFGGFGMGGINCLKNHRFGKGGK